MTNIISRICLVWRVVCDATWGSLEVWCPNYIKAYELTMHVDYHEDEKKVLLDWLVLWDAILNLHLYAFEVILEWCYHDIDDKGSIMLIWLRLFSYSQQLCLYVHVKLMLETMLWSLWLCYKNVIISYAYAICWLTIWAALLMSC